MNMEDCPQCMRDIEATRQSGGKEPNYPWICPGHNRDYMIIRGKLYWIKEVEWQDETDGMEAFAVYARAQDDPTG